MLTAVRFKRKRTLPHMLHKVASIVMLAALLAGLLPPPLVSSALNVALPQALAQPVADMSQALLPATKAAQAAEPAPVANQKTLVATGAAAPVAKPLSQGLTSSNVLTITKTVVGAGSGPYNITVTGPSGYVNNTTITPGTPVVLTGLASGVYTVTESSPGTGWTTVYTAAASTGSATGGGANAVVTLQNSNTATLAATPISGKVFRDFNSNGQITINGIVTDTGVSGVTITAYAKNGNSVGSATSATNGTYTINPTGAGPYRVVFSNLPSGYVPTMHGSDNGTSTQFVTTAAGASNVNLGVLYPGDYASGNQRLLMPTYLNGDITGHANLASDYALVGFNYSLPSLTPIVSAAQVGALWGVAYRNTTKHVFGAAVLKRHAGLGPRGLDGVYVIDAATNTIAGGFDLEGVTASNGGTISLGSVTRTAVSGAIANDASGDTQLSSVATEPSVDLDAFDKVGKVGFGDIEIDQETKLLWLVNLNERTLLAVDPSLAPLATSTPNNVPSAAVRQYRTVSGVGPAAAPLITGMPSCTNGNQRPWGLAFRNGTGYLGVVCDAANSANKNPTAASNELQAYVLAFNPTAPSAFTVVVGPINLAYTRERAFQGSNGGSFTAGTWQRWASNWGDFDESAFTAAPQPILSGLAFADDGSLLLAFSDRGALMSGWLNYRAIAFGGVDAQGRSARQLAYTIAAGDLLRVPYSNGALGSPESGANDPGSAPLAPNVTTFLANDSAGNHGEFFYGDYLPNSSGSDVHQETLLGAVAVVPGRSEAVSTAYDVKSAFQQGVLWLNSAASTDANFRWAAYSTCTSNGWPCDIQRFGKGGGLGDLEALINPAPVEIGNRVWNDLNGNGIQDPGEPGLSGLTVSLQGPTNTVTINTDANGLYYFNVNRSTAYTLTLTPPSGYSVTTANAAALSGASATSNAAISDTIDSDAVVVNGQATIYYTAGGAGQNNHGLDFGFTQPVTGQAGITNIAPVQIGNRLWIETDSDGDATTGAITPVVSQVVTATSSSGGVYTATTDSNGLYTITVPANDTYTVTTDVPAGTLPSTVLTSVANDSNAAANDNKSHLYTGTVVTVANSDNLSVDFGFWTPQPSILVKKYTNGDDADLPTGPTVEAGSVVTWTYVITNTGNVTLTTITLVDDQEGSVSCPPTTLAPGLGTTCILTGTAKSGQYANRATVIGPPTVSPVGVPLVPVTSTNASHYLGLTAGLGDRVWYDTNHNGVQDLGESGVPSVTVQLLNSSGTVISTTTTSATGYYSFTNVTPGVYAIRFVPSTLPTGYQFTFANRGGDATADSDADVNTGETATTVLVGNEYDPTWDAGIWLAQPSILLKKYTNGYDADTVTGPYIQVGDVVTWTYVMTNTGNVTLTNISLTDDQVFGLTCPALDLAPGASTSCTETDVATAGQYTNTATVTGVPTMGVATPVTSTNLSHYFGVEPAFVLKKYTNGYDADTLSDARPQLVLGAPVTWTYDITNTGNVTLRFAANSLTDNPEGVLTHPAFTLLPGASKTLTLPGTVKTLGIYTNTATLTGVPSVPAAGTPDLPAFPTATVTTPVTATNASHYEGLGLSLGNRLWVDNGAGSAANRNNGVYDAGEPAAPQGIVVELLDITGTVLAAQTTDSNGYYRFDDLAVGSYQVRIPASEFAVGGKLYGYVSSTGQTTTFAAGDNNRDHGDDVVSDGVTSGVIALGVSNPTGEVDGGATGASSNGQNGDAYDNLTSDFGFVPMATFGNFVWIESDSDGIASTRTITPVVGLVLTATDSNGTVYNATTDANGYYTFSVPADVYTVTYGSVPASYGTVVPSTMPNSGTVDNSNLGVDQQSRPNNTVVTLVAGDSIPTIDFSFHTPLAQFGDRVWIESDDDGLASTGVITPVAGMVLTATSGTHVYTATTDSQGYYSFTVLAGTYTVHYGAVPASYGTVRPSNGAVGSSTLSGNAGSYQASGNPDTNHPQNTTVTVADGEANWQVDYAFATPRSDLSLTKTADKTVAAQGETLIYSLVLTNHGPDDAANIQVMDLLPASVTWVSDSGAGAYDHTTGLWMVNSLAANASVTLTITVTMK